MGVPLRSRRRSARAASGGQSDAVLGSITGEALVSQSQRQPRGACHCHCPFARPGRLQAFAAVHVQWQSYDQTRGSLFRRKSRYDERVVSYRPGPTQGGERRGGAGVQVAQGHSDSTLPEIDAEDSARRPGACASGLRHQDADGLDVPPGVGEDEGEPPDDDGAGVPAGDGAGLPL